MNPTYTQTDLQEGTGPMATQLRERAAKGISELQQQHAGEPLGTRRHCTLLAPRLQQLRPGRDHHQMARGVAGHRGLEQDGDLFLQDYFNILYASQLLAHVQYELLPENKLARE